MLWSKTVNLPIARIVIGRHHQLAGSSSFASFPAIQLGKMSIKKGANPREFAPFLSKN